MVFAEKCAHGQKCKSFGKSVLHALMFKHNGPKTEGVKRPTEGKDGCPAVKIPRLMAMSSEHLKIRVQEFCFISYPDHFFEFWNEIKCFASDSQDPCDLFKCIGIKLVGVFDAISGHFTEEELSEESFVIMNHRYETDLPEMQTVAESKNGRYAFWWDAPDSSPLIVFVAHGTKNFPKLEIIGDCDLRNMIAHAVGSKPARDVTELIDGNWSKVYQDYAKAVKKVIADRKKLTLGSPFHGIGILINVKDDVGYRPLNLSQKELKKLLMDIGTTDDEVQKEVLKKNLNELFTTVQFATDEMDFGTGLEFGHDLLWSNFKIFDKMAGSVLRTAYTQLNRHPFVRILNFHLSSRESSQGKLICG